MGRYTIAIDPGLVTGVAVFNHSTGDVESFEIPGGLSGFVDFWYFSLFNWCPVRVIIEDWIVRPNTHKMTPQPDPYLIIGYVQGWCHLENVDFMKIGPSEHKSFNGKGKQSKVRRIGWVLSTTKDGHAEDACSLLLTGLLRYDRDLIAPLLKEIADE